MISQVLEPLVALQQQNRLGHAYILEGVQITQDDSYLVAEGLGVSLQDIIYECLEEELKRYTYSPVACPKIYCHQLGDSAGVLGAALLALI